MKAVPNSKGRPIHGRSQKRPPTKRSQASSEISVRLGAPDSEFSQQFVQGMADRMAFSYHKYGPVAKNYPVPAHALDSLSDRLKKYEQTGNTEYLMDVGNFAMIEFMRPAHSQAFFQPTDANESPGLRLWTGKRVQDHPTSHTDDD